MNEFINLFVVVNGNLCSVSSLHSVEKSETIVLYEVVRLIGGKILFLEDHLQRLLRSALYKNIQLHTTVETIYHQLKDLILANNTKDGNIKLKILCSPAKQDIIAGFIPHSYPTPQMYEQGVKTMLFSAERNTPNAKVQNDNLRTQTEHFLKANDLYEIMLVDTSGNITEGSKSNLFFVKDEKVFTALPEDVLRGITREKVVEICNEISIPLVEEKIPAAILSSFDAAFITGTSPKVLPIATCGTVLFNPQNPIVKKLIKHYDLKLSTDKLPY